MACLREYLIVSLIFSSVAILSVLGNGGSYVCPTDCSCIMKGTSKKPSLTPKPTLTPKPLEFSPLLGRKVTCKGVANRHLRYVDRQLIDKMPKDTVLLDLSENEIRSLEKDIFEGLTNVHKLNVSFNPIIQLEAGAFEGLASLKILDLSSTKLSIINASMLEGIPKLERLLLINTPVKLFDSNSLDVLPALNKLDLQSDFLMCDCHLRWFVGWVKSRNEATLCGLPSELKGRQLKGLRDEELHCDWPLELPVFELVPATNQVVFEGDKLPFRCRATHVEKEMKIDWIHEENKIVSNRSLGYFIHIETLPDVTLKTSLVLEHLSVQHSGIWKCLVQSSSGNVSKSVTVVVLSQDMKYCPATVTNGNKGSYYWPKTLAGVVRSLPCSIGDYGKSSGEENAYHSCDERGSWIELDTSNCPYFNEVTRLLEQTLSSNFSSYYHVDEAIKKMISSTSNGSLVGDYMEVIFVSQFVELISKNIHKLPLQVVQKVLDLIGSIMNAKSSLLVAAQEHDRACTRIVKSLEEIIDQLLLNVSTISYSSRNIAVEARRVEPYAFPGMNCTDWVGVNETNNYQFICSGLDDVRILKSGMHLSSSISIPGDILMQVQCSSPRCSQTQDDLRIQFIVYRNARLFPSMDESSTAAHVMTGVISSKIAGVRMVENSTSPLAVKLMSSAVGVTRTPVYWDFSANSGFGAWKSQGCKLDDDNDDKSFTTKFKCSHLASFAVAEGALPPSTAFELLVGSLSQMSAFIFMGSVCLTLLLLAVIIIYIVCRSKIKMSRKSRHAVVNLCLAALMLCVVFTLGIRVRAPVVMCRVVGIIIHYLSLCVLFWITVITFKMFNKLAKRHRPPPSPEELLDEPPQPKPIITGYLLGWGVAIIICGISGAINWNNYAAEDNKYCFLSMEAAMLTFFIPAGVLGFIDCVLFFRIGCLIQSLSTLNSATIESSNNETEELHENEIELLRAQTIPTNNVPSASLNSSSPLATSTNSLDVVYCPCSQLCATVAMLLLYCATWTTGALSIALPLSSFLNYNEIIFQCLYAVLATAFGAFLFVYYCVGRKDVRAVCLRRRSVTNGNWKYVPANAEAPPMPLMNGHVTQPDVVGETLSLTSRSVRSNVESDHKQPLAIMKTCAQQVTEDPSFTPVQDCSMFYNPRQNNIAKKYWERTKKKRGNNNGMRQETNVGRIRDMTEDDSKGVERFDDCRNGVLPGDGKQIRNLGIDFIQNNGSIQSDCDERNAVRNDCDRSDGVFTVGESNPETAGRNGLGVNVTSLGYYANVPKHADFLSRNFEMQVKLSPQLPYKRTMDEGPGSTLSNGELPSKSCVPKQSNAEKSFPSSAQMRSGALHEQMQSRCDSLKRTAEPANNSACGNTGSLFKPASVCGPSADHHKQSIVSDAEQGKTDSSIASSPENAAGSHFIGQIELRIPYVANVCKKPSFTTAANKSSNVNNDTTQASKPPTGKSLPKNDICSKDVRFRNLVNQNVLQDSINGNDFDNIKLPDSRPLSRSQSEQGQRLVADAAANGNASQSEANVSDGGPGGNVWIMQNKDTAEEFKKETSV